MSAGSLSDVRCHRLGPRRAGCLRGHDAQLVASARRAALLAGGDEDAPLVRELDEVSVFPGVPLH